jgi:DNA-binding transcriptional ArsR family regulator
VIVRGDNRGAGTINRMVKSARAPLDAVFSALADPTRREILARLAEGESSVTCLAEPFDISLPAISRHLKVLEGAGLLAREKDGRVHRIRLVPDSMLDALEWMAHYGRFWEEQLDSLDAFVRERKPRRVS